MSPRSRRYQRCRRNGGTAVEVAACLPILVLLLFGSYELGRANMLHHACESAAYEGARVGVVPGTNPKKIEDAARFVLESVDARDAEVIITPSVIEKDTRTVKVEIRIPMKKNTLLIPFFTKETVFQGECEMTRETF